MNLAFTLRQAKAISKDFQALVGKNFYSDPTKTGKVAHVAVAPFDDINKWIFIQNLKDCNCVFESLSYYTAPFYDVLIIGPVVETDKPPVFTDLRTYLQENDISFNVADYSLA